MIMFTSGPTFFRSFPLLACSSRHRAGVLPAHQPTGETTMSYRVTLNTAFSVTGIAKHYMTRPQAIHGMRKLAYGVLQDFAKLDTKAAHDVMAAVDACDD